MGAFMWVYVKHSYMYVCVCVHVCVCVCLCLLKNVYVVRAMIGTSGLQLATTRGLTSFYTILSIGVNQTIFIIQTIFIQHKLLRISCVVMETGGKDQSICDPRFNQSSPVQANKSLLSLEASTSLDDDKGKYGSESFNCKLYQAASSPFIISDSSNANSNGSQSIESRIHSSSDSVVEITISPTSSGCLTGIGPPPELIYSPGGSLSVPGQLPIRGNHDYVTLRSADGSGILRQVNLSGSGHLLGGGHDQHSLDRSCQEDGQHPSLPELPDLLQVKSLGIVPFVTTPL